MNVFPRLKGNFPVGTTTYYWTDKTRQETLNAEANTHRELIIQIWYPANNSSRPYDSYAHEIMSEWKAGLKQTGFPEDQIDELDRVFTHTKDGETPDASQAPYPVIIFSHGYVALRSSYTAYCQELASHGYVVVAIGHTYYTQLAKFPDGRTISALPEHWQQTKLTEEVSSNKEQRLWLDDAQFVLDQLTIENTDQNSLIYKLMDLNNVGAFGHSFGGSTAVQLCRHDSRCKAVVDLDGGLFGTQATENFHKPMMALVGEISYDQYRNHTDNDIATRTSFPLALVTHLRKNYYEGIPRILHNLDSDTYFIKIQGADHGAFSDWVLLKHLPLYENNKHFYDLNRDTGPINGLRMHEIVSAYLVAFFDRYLKNKLSDLLLRSSPYQEVEIQPKSTQANHRKD